MKINNAFERGFFPSLFPIIQFDGLPHTFIKRRDRNEEEEDMCGRVNARVSPADVRAAFDLALPPEWDDADRHSGGGLINCGPSSTLPTLFSSIPEGEGGGDNNERCRVKTTRFGLVPSFAKHYDPRRDHYAAFNCRAETMLERRAFNRCAGRSVQCPINGNNFGERGHAVALIRGFYEWKKEFGDGRKAHQGQKRKQPYYVSRKDGKLLCVAALVDTYKDEHRGDVRTTSLLTKTSAGTRLSWLHDRMPVMLSREGVKLWMEAKTKARWMIDEEHSDAKGMIETGENLQWHPVTPEMGKVEFQGEECVKEVVAMAKKNTQDIKSMFAKAVAKQSAEKLSRVKIVADDKREDDGEEEPPLKKKKLKM